MDFVDLRGRLTTPRSRSGTCPEYAPGVVSRESKFPLSYAPSKIASIQSPGVCLVRVSSELEYDSRLATRMTRRRRNETRRTTRESGDGAIYKFTGGEKKREKTDASKLGKRSRLYLPATAHSCTRTRTQLHGLSSTETVALWFNCQTVWWWID